MQATRSRNTNRMQSNANVPVKTEISLRETTIDGCVQKRKKSGMELQLEKAVRFLQKDQPQRAGGEGSVPAVTEVLCAGSEVHRPL